MFLELTLALSAVATAIFLVRVYPDATARWFNRIQRFRRAIYAVLIVLVASVLIGSGSPGLMLWGFALLVLTALSLVVDGPLEDHFS
ncbi:MAG: hypothetical protein ACOCQY_05095 [Halorhabdus sp.]